MLFKNKSFDIIDCELHWNQESPIPDTHKEAIKEAIESKKTRIESALKFAAKNRVMIVFKLEAKIDVDWDYSIIISSEMDETTVPIKIIISCFVPGKDIAEVAYINNKKLQIETVLPDPLKNGQFTIL